MQEPIENAEVIVAGASHRTDAAGTTTLVTAAGNIGITVVKPGFVPVTTSVQMGAGATQELIVELQPQPSVEESVTVVASTRPGQASRGSADARRGARARGNRREDAHDAR